MGQGAGRGPGGPQHQVRERQRQTGRDTGPPVLRRRNHRQSHGGEARRLRGVEAFAGETTAIVTLKNERTAIRQHVVKIGRPPS